MLEIIYLINKHLFYIYHIFKMGKVILTFTNKKQFINGEIK